MIAPERIDPKAKKERALRKYKEENKSRWFNVFWKSKARQVNEERYNFYKAKGNSRKADIYGRKIGKV